jgi:TIR domain
MPSVFISYSSKDSAFVDKLYADLKRRKIRPWVDRWEIGIGESIRSRVEQGIIENDFLILVLSKYSTKSTWVMEEYDAAFNLAMKKQSVVVLPILLEDCDIPLFLQGKKYADFRSNYNEGLYNLLCTLEPSKSTYYRRWLEKKRRDNDPPSLPGRVKFGRFGELAIYMIAGGEEGRFQYNDINFSYEDLPKVLPPDLEQTRQTLLAEKISETKQRGSPLEDNPLVYMRKLAFLTEAFDKLNIVLGPSSYFQYAPFMYKLDRPLTGKNETIRESYFVNPDEFENSFLPSEVSINLNVICDHGRQLLILQRGQRVAVAPGRLAEAVGGAVNRTRDWDNRHNSPSPFLAAVHEAKEELNLDIFPEQITFRSIILGLDDPAICFTGDVNVDETADTILKRSSFASHKEGVGYHAVPFNPKDVSQFLRKNNDNLTHISLFSILSTLCSVRYFGWERTEQAFGV